MKDDVTFSYAAEEEPLAVEAPLAVAEGEAAEVDVIGELGAESGHPGGGEKGEGAGGEEDRRGGALLQDMKKTTQNE